MEHEALNALLLLMDTHFIDNDLERCQNKERGEESSWSGLQRKRKARKGLHSKR